MCGFCLSLATQNVQPSRPESHAVGLCCVMVCYIEHVAMFFVSRNPAARVPNSWALLWQAGSSRSESLSLYSSRRAIKIFSSRGPVVTAG